MPEQQKQNYHVPAEYAGWTLAAILRKLHPEWSWSQVRRLIHHRHVEVNGNLCTDDARRLKPADVVALWQEPKARPVRPEDIEIYYQDEHLIVLNKPAGITTLRSREERHWPKRRRQLQPTLDEMLLQILAETGPSAKASSAAPQAEDRSHRLPRARTRAGKKRGPTPWHRRLYPVHRLDRDTSGLMLFALSPEAYQPLLRTFRRHEVHRLYVALVLGRLEEQSITSSLVRDRGDGLRGSTQQPGIGQRAVTHVRPVEYLPGYTLVECRLETGRTHQIRIHLAEAGHPICGEKMYNHPLHSKPIQDPSGAQRQMLHAAELGLRHPLTGEELFFRSPLPDDMRRLLEKLRQHPEETS